MLLRWCRGNDLHSFLKSQALKFEFFRRSSKTLRKSVERFQFPIKLFLIYSLVLLVRGLCEISLILIIWIDLTDMKYIYAINLKEYKNLIILMKRVWNWNKLSFQFHSTLVWKMKKIFLNFSFTCAFVECSSFVVFLLHLFDWKKKDFNASKEKLELTNSMIISSDSWNWN
jgi:hypothetical protein